VVPTEQERDLYCSAPKIRAKSIGAVSLRGCLMKKARAIALHILCTACTLCLAVGA